MIRTAADLELAFRFGRYPPHGVRGVGGERAVKWGLDFEDYLRCADEETLIIPLIETREAVENIDRLLEVAGLEVIFFGPADLSASYGYLSQWEGPGVAEQIHAIRDRAACQGIASGILSRNPEDAVTRRDQGFGMVGLGADLNLMLRAIQQIYVKLGREVGSLPARRHATDGSQRDD